LFYYKTFGERTRMIPLYFAPLEGITTHIYRRVHARMFGGCGAYYAPFIVPSAEERVTRRRMRDILPENNSGVPLRVQVLTDNAAAFCAFAEKIRSLGYGELNLNLGCPAPTVVGKGRGAAQLRDPEGLDRLLSDIFSQTDMPVSVKTRLGFADRTEMERLLPVFNRYPLSLLILHPRTRAQLYGGVPDIEAFAAAYTESKSDICYNGNITSAAEYFQITERFPRLAGVMIGRGAVQNPAIFREIRGGERLRSEELASFTAALAEEYRAAKLGEGQVLMKLKEIWAYCIARYPGEKKIAREMKKADTVGAFLAAACALPPLP